MLRAANCGSVPPMRKYISCLILGILFFGCGTPEIANIASTGKTIVCFGDSITAGVGASTNEDYPTLLSHAVSQPVINAGKNGDTTWGALQRIERDVLEHDPLLVIVILGGNDFLQRAPMSKTFENLTAIIRRIKAQGAMVALGQLGPIAMYQYRSRYAQLAKQEGAFLIPRILKGIFGNTELMSDGIHPNADGYVHIAQRVERAIRPLLEKNARLRVGGQE